MSQTDLIFYETGVNEDDKESDTFTLWICMGKIVTEVDDTADATHLFLGQNRYLQHSMYHMSTVQIEGDDVEFEDYKVFAKNWLSEAYRLLKDDGRIAINIPYEINRQKKGGRIFFVSEMWQIMKEIGYGFFGIVDLEEQSPHRSKTTAWGSWMSPSSPYIYNPKECVVLAYKKQHIKKIKGQPQWIGELTEIENEDGTKRNKMVYKDEDKKEENKDKKKKEKKEKKGKPVFKNMYYPKFIDDENVVKNDCDLNKNMIITGNSNIATAASAAFSPNLIDLALII
jgi:hypothetical protein